MKNKKGFTIVEIIVSFAIVAVLGVSFFRVITVLKEKQAEILAKNELYAFQSMITKLLYEDLNSYKVVAVDNSGTDNEINLTYSNGRNANLKFDYVNNTISYGGITYELPQYAKLPDLDTSLRNYYNSSQSYICATGIYRYENFTSTDTDVTKNNSILAFHIPIYSNNVEGDYGITFNYQYNSFTDGIDYGCDISTSSYAGFDSSKGVNKPVITAGLTPVKWNGSAWVTTTENDSDWYNYDSTNKKWANATSADGSMWVWIPRYAYQIANGYHLTTNTGSVNIKFLMGTTNTTVDGTILGTTPTYASSAQTNFVKHPAFSFGGVEVPGFWVAKFEPSNVGGNVESKPSTTSWRAISISDAFSTVFSMRDLNAKYGWSASSVDTHMAKNSEWAAITYLIESIYGKQTEVWSNNSSTFQTGCTGTSYNAASFAGCEYAYSTANGVNGSTTGNIYGVYDMAGGSNDLLASYVNNNNAALNANGANLINAESKYKDVYPVGVTDTAANNYNATNSFFGHGLYEVSSTGSSSTGSWNSDAAFMPYSTSPFFTHGGFYFTVSTGQPFAFNSSSGVPDASASFRPILIVLD